MELIDKVKLKQELEAIGASMSKDATVAVKIGEVIVAIAAHTATRTAAAFAVAAKRQESADQLIADLEQRVSELERGKATS